MKLNRIMIAAPKSGSGKTTITCALLQALKDRGERVVSYKCGPDYIDPMFHQKVLGVSSKNLDTFFTGEACTRRLFLQSRTEEDLAVMEGVMGLYDGLGGVRKEGSSYHLAQVTKTPILLVVDTKGMGRSALALIAGFLQYDTDHLIRGVILNRTSKAMFELLKPLIEEELHILAVGYFPDSKELLIGSRHLGLMLPQELTDLRKKLREAAEIFMQTVSLEKIMEIACGAEPLEEDGLAAGIDPCGEENCPLIAVAKDEAFCFYYEDNLRLLEQFGAKIEYFSPLRDKALPAGTNGILLGGGYPELHAKELSENRELMEQIKSALSDGMPVVAECGGFMYLHSVLEDQKKQPHAMAGALQGSCHYAGKLVRFGYIEVLEKRSSFLPEGESIRGHEFHYFDSENNGEDCLAVKPVTKKSYPCVISDENCWLGFPHLYYPSNPAFAENFVKKAADYRRKKGE